MSPEELERVLASVGPHIDALFEGYEKKCMDAAAKRLQPVTAQDLAEPDDTHLVYRIYTRLHFRAEKNLELEVSPLSAYVYALYHLAGEIGNGGFHQYFCNTRAEGLDGLAQAAGLLTGLEAQGVITEAIKRARGHPYERGNERTHFERGYAERWFDDLDDRYDAQAGAVMQRLAATIRSNAADFVEGP